MRASSPALVLLGVLTGCVGDGASGGGGSGGFDGFNGFDGCQPQVIQVIKPDHGHTLFTLGIDQQITDIQDHPDDSIVLGGNAGHTHRITRAGRLLDPFVNDYSRSVTVETTNDSLHSHEVTISVSFPPACGGVYDGGPQLPPAPGG